MSKIWRLRVLTVYLTLGIPLAASCAREANNVEGDDSGGGSGSGGSGSGGSLPKAGTTSVAGTSNGSAFGGTAGKAGVAGDTAAGGDASSSGAGNDSGGTSTGVPPDVLARASAVVLYQTDQTSASTKTINMKLFVENHSADALSMAHVKIRYWFTAEVATELHQYYTGAQAQLPKAVFVDDGANSHVLMTFGGGTIKQGDDLNFSEIQLTVANNTSPFDQSDDFSFMPSAVSKTPNDKITLYLDDQLIWGCEPSGKCFDAASGAGGAGSGGQGGAGMDAAGGAGMDAAGGAGMDAAGGAGMVAAGGVAP